MLRKFYIILWLLVITLIPTWMLCFLLKTAESKSLISVVERLKVNIEEQLCNLASVSCVNYVPLYTWGQRALTRLRAMCVGPLSQILSHCVSIWAVFLYFSSAHHLYRHGNDLLLPLLEWSDLFCVSIFICLSPIYFRSWVKSKNQLGINQSSSSTFNESLVFFSHLHFFFKSKIQKTMMY